MLRSILVVALVMSFGSPVLAQQNEPCPERSETCRIAPPKVVPKKDRKKPIYDMTKVDIVAKNRKLMLMTFIDRASEELERATLDRRSFMPELLKTVDAETL